MRMKMKIYGIVAIGLPLSICLLMSPQPVQAQFEPFGVYEDWSSPTIRSDRWLGRADDAQEVRREVTGKGLLMRYRREGWTISNVGYTNVYHRIFPINAAAINQIEADLIIKGYEVVGCAANPSLTAVRPAAISLNRFNDGTSPEPGNMIGDHIMRISVIRDANSTDPRRLFKVQAFLFRCRDRDCVDAVSTINPVLGSVRKGDWFTLRIIWDEPNNRFWVGLNNGPDVAVNYAPNLNNKPAVKPFADVRMQLVAGNCMAAPTVTDAEILVGEVRTNVSAIIP